VHNILLYLFPIYCIFPGFQAENGVLMCNQKLIIDDREVQGLESWWMPVHEIALSRWRDLSNKIFLNLVMEVAHVPQSSTWPPIFFSLSSWRSWFKAGFIWPHIGYRVRTKKPLDLFKQVHFTILLVVYALRYSCSILFIICVASIMLNWKIFSYFRFPWPRLRVTYSGYGLIFRVKSGFMSVFGSVVAGAFQITFRAKIHANDIFSFFKNHFWHQHIKTIQNI